LFRYCQGIIHFDAQISKGAFDLGVAKQKLDGPKITSATVDQGCLRASERMRSKQPRVQPDASDPLRDETGILAGCHTALRAATAGEQELAGPFAGSLEIIINRLPGLFAQFKSDRPSGLLLPDRGAICCVSARSDILDFDCDDITASKFAVNRQVEHGEVTSATFDLEFRPD
jgi:hypothetical protein